jgi:teichoic acid transport system permease protein
MSMESQPPDKNGAVATVRRPWTRRDGHGGLTRDDEFTGTHHVYEPHAAGIPPLRSYVREIWRRRAFALELSRTRLRAQHFDTVFGQLWLVLNPLLLAGVYFILVDILRPHTSGLKLFAHLMGCLFAYYFVATSMREGVKSVVKGGRLILNTAFPRALLPLASVLNAFIRFVPAVLIYVPVHVLAGLPVGPQDLWILPLTALLVVMATGLAMLVAALQVYFRDLANFLPYLLRVWVYVSPILYFASRVPDRYHILLTLNPIASILTAWSDILIFGRTPDPADIAQGTAWAFGIFVVGSLFFVSREREFAVRL